MKLVPVAGPNGHDTRKTVWGRQVYWSIDYGATTTIGANYLSINDFTYLKRHGRHVPMITKTSIWHSALSAYLHSNFEGE